MTLLKRISTVLMAAVVVTGLLAMDAKAISDTEREAIRGNFPWWAIPQPLCGGSTASTGTPLEGHSLPAAKGGTGNEDPLTPDGRAIHKDGTLSEKPVSFANLIPEDAAKSQLYRDYYITMRWNYASWNWNGTSGGAGSEDRAWYGNPPNNEPRRVLVTNPENNKSIIAVVLESGPGPWAGLTSSPDSAIPTIEGKPVWKNPTIGTPDNYGGRVSGLPPKAIEALKATQRMSDGTGVDLLYSWAPDQTATPGPLSTGAVAGGALVAACSSDLSGNLRRDTSSMHCPTAQGITEVEAIQDGYFLNQPVKIRTCKVQGVEVNVLVALNINNMINAAKTEGINLSGGGFRTMQEQIATRRANGCTVIMDIQACLKENVCGTDTACPGYSNHQMGLAVDWASSGKLINIGNPSTRPAFDWLKAHAASYGFKNLPTENWHWSVDGG